MKTRSLLATAFALAGTVAHACPTAADLAPGLPGIRIDYGEDGHSIVLREPNGVLRETEYSGEEIYVFVTENGLLETAYEEPNNGTEEFFEYTFDTNGIAPPELWSGQIGEQITRDKTGAETARVGYSYYTRGRTAFMIGDCRYTKIGVQTYYEHPDEKSLVEFAYVVELGIPVAVGFGGQGYFDAYHPTGIAVID